MVKLSSIGSLEWYRNSILAKEGKSRTRVNICMTGCRAHGAAEVRSAIQEEISVKGLEEEVEVRSTGCHGFCAKAPVLSIEPQGVQYEEVTPEDAPEIVRETLLGKRFIERLCYHDPETGAAVPYRREIPFYRNQVRRVLSNCGRIDPKEIDQYIAAGGYQAAVRALSRMTPEQVIDEVTRAGLRGRGGAGFPTGRKWHLAREAEGSPKYVVCNADEGDPGAFMDRAVLEGDPHAVLEGMIIGAYAMGAAYGFIYVREEYPIAVEHLTRAIEQMEALGLLGEDILGTGMSFHLSLKTGAGAFVCGEETALMASIEGKRGMPSPRPPFPAQAGLDGKPTNINNVETWANVPLILKNGVDWYTEVGTEASKGTKIFSLAGKVNHTGLVEVPLGTPIREVVFDIGGGIPKDRAFKAVQMGGPSGGCVPARYLDLPIDYDTIQRIGAIMGSGGMVVMDENNCMVEIARFFLSFTQSESCGKCAPCRLGTTQLLEILTRITQGRGRLEDIEVLQDLGQTVTDASLCGLGQTCAKPALSTLRYFEKEYEDHILEHRCAGATCDAMVISACQHACPAGIDVPNYVASIAAGKYEQAVAIIRERNPFPAVCGRICIHPCEFKCRRGELDDPVAIRALKRFAADWYFEHIGRAEAPFPVTRSHKVAVVGAGPAGLTCAYFLAKIGYPVHVFEAQPMGGGMLGLAIPEFRLPRGVIQEEIAYIESCGVTIHYESPIDARHTVHDLMEEGYEAVFIAAGAQAAKSMGIPGEDEGVEGILHGLRFLTEVRSGKDIRLKGKVVVLGGGNVALDVARTALRVGAEDVQIFYRRTIEEMPAWKKDIDEALEEGVTINPLWAPRRILHQDGRVRGMEFMRSRTVLDPEGGTRLSVDETSTQTVEADAVIVSVGQAPDISFLSEDTQLERALWGSLVVDENSLSTNIPGIFAGGDFTTGPSTVIQAIASGRRAALAVDRYLLGEKGRLSILDEKTDLHEESGLALDEETQEPKPRAEIDMERADQRRRDFREVEKGLNEEQARYEAMRCLRCDLERERRGDEA
ncbi:MAG: FAD-dependent oxidoreductase [Desulfobacteraceae bacterium]|jgi:NADH-quinone oxidoreductase subunit F